MSSSVLKSHLAGVASPILWLLLYSHYTEFLQLHGDGSRGVVSGGQVTCPVWVLVNSHVIRGGQPEGHRAASPETGGSQGPIHLTHLPAMPFCFASRVCDLGQPSRQGMVPWEKGQSLLPTLPRALIWFMRSFHCQLGSRLSSHMEGSRSISEGRGGGCGQEPEGRKKGPGHSKPRALERYGLRWKGVAGKFSLLHYFN